jgi:hypothetical protein
MKKITLVLAFLAVSLGYGQQVLIEDFESGSALDGGFSGLASSSVVADPEAGGSRGQVARLEVVAGAGDPWQGANVNFTTNVDLTTDKTITMDIYSDNPIDILVKVDSGIDGAPPSAVDVQHPGGSVWVETIVSFTTPRDNTSENANGVYPLIAVFPNWDATTPPGSWFNPPVNAVVYLDNIRAVAAVPSGPSCSDGMMNGNETGVDCGGPDCAPCAVPPSSAPPTPPSRAAADVISIYGDAYGTAIGLNNVPWDDPTNFVEEEIAGNNVLALTLGTFMGSSLGSVVDASGMTHIHMDFWVADGFVDGQVFNPKLSNHAESAGETNAIEGTIALPGDGTQNQTWVSYDVEIESLFDNDPNDDNAPFERANITEFLITTAGLIGTAYLDNVYLHNNVVLSNDDFSKISFKAFPNPTQDSWSLRGETQIESVRVIDILGKEVLSLSPNSKEATIDGSSLKSGLYFAQVKSLSGLQSIKLIKQ